MDPIIAKTIVSRKKSIAVLETEIAAIELKIKLAAIPAAVVVLRDMVKVKQLRLTKLKAELVALEQLVAPDVDQVELPGVAAAPAAPPPGGPVKVPGRR